MFHTIGLKIGNFPGRTNIDLKQQYEISCTQIHSIENRLMVSEVSGVGELGGKGKGIKKYKLPVTRQSWDYFAKCSIENKVNNIVITIYGATWILKIVEGPLYKV